MKVRLRLLPTFSPLLGQRVWSARATPPERTRALPGDELIEQLVGSLQHAITIRRPRHEVWPWHAPTGAGSRAGWYTQRGWLPSQVRRMNRLGRPCVEESCPALS
jgi:hypothetical protein